MEYVCEYILLFNLQIGVKSLYEVELHACNSSANRSIDFLIKQFVIINKFHLLICVSNFIIHQYTCNRQQNKLTDHKNYALSSQTHPYGLMRRSDKHLLNPQNRS